MSAPAGGAAAPAATGAVDRPTDQEVIALLRAHVPKFRDLPPQQRLLSADLKLELQRHKGGAACLPEKFRRKVPAGHEHLIVNAPSLKVLASGIRPPLYYMGKTHVVQGFQPANVVHVSAPL